MTTPPAFTRRGLIGTSSALAGLAGKPVGARTVMVQPSLNDLTLSFITVAELVKSSIPFDVISVILHGYYTPYDNAGHIRRRGASTDPSALQSADGAWWSYVPVNGNDVYVHHFGARADWMNETQLGTDNEPFFQRALDFAVSIGGTLRIPAGSFRTTGTLGFKRTDPEQFGLRIVGEGKQKTIIVADHLNGPAVSLNRSNGLIQDLTILSSKARSVGAPNANYGLLMEAPDTGSAAVANMSIIRVQIILQPSHGIVHVGLTMTSYYEQVLVQSNKGHGFVFDTGQISNRLNQTYPGLVTIIGCWSLGNVGHALKIGDANDTAGNEPVRFLMLNCEFAENAQLAGVRTSADQVWIRGVNITFDTCAIGAASASLTGGIRFAGENLQVRNHRAVGTANTLRLEADHALETTFGISIDGLRVLNRKQDPAIVITDLSKVRDVSVSTHGDRGNIARMFTPNATRAFWSAAPTVSCVILSSDQVIYNSAQLTPLREFSIFLEANDRVIFEANLAYSGSSLANIKFNFTAPEGGKIRWDNDKSIYVDAEYDSSIWKCDGDGHKSKAFYSDGEIRTVNIRGYLSMGSRSGPLQMYFSQKSAIEADTRICAGSSLRVIRGNMNN